MVGLAVVVYSGHSSAPLGREREDIPVWDAPGGIVLSGNGGSSGHSLDLRRYRQCCAGYLIAARVQMMASYRLFSLPLFSPSQCSQYTGVLHNRNANKPSVLLAANTLQTGGCYCQ